MYSSSAIFKCWCTQALRPSHSDRHTYMYVHMLLIQRKIFAAQYFSYFLFVDIFFLRFSANAYSFSSTHVHTSIYICVYLIKILLFIFFLNLTLFSLPLLRAQLPLVKKKLNKIHKNRGERGYGAFTSVQSQVAGEYFACSCCGTFP